MIISKEEGLAEIFYFNIDNIQLGITRLFGDHIVKAEDMSLFLDEGMPKKIVSIDVYNRSVFGKALSMQEIYKIFIKIIFYNDNNKRTFTIEDL